MFIAPIAQSIEPNFEGTAHKAKQGYHHHHRHHNYHSHHQHRYNKGFISNMNEKQQKMCFGGLGGLCIGLSAISCGLLSAIMGIIGSASVFLAFSPSVRKSLLKKCKI